MNRILPTDKVCSMAGPGILVVFMMIIHSYALHAQSNQGKSFWFGFMEHVDKGINKKVAMITSQTATSGEVSMPLKNWSYSFQVVPNEVTIVPLPSSAETIGSERATNNGILLVSLAPVSVYIHQYSGARSEAAAVLPTHAIGKEYYAMSYQGFRRQNTEYPSEMMIVAAEDDSHIEVELSTSTLRGRKQGDKININLDAGEVYQIQGRDNQDDMTGTYVTGDKDFALFAGAVWTEVPSGCGARDNLLEQMYPISTWGKQYVTSPNFGASYDIFRILASENDTKVDISNGITHTLQAGEFAEYRVFGTSTYVQSNNPILLGQFNVGQNCSGHAVGDPSLVLLNSIEQTRDTVTLFNSKFQDITEHYLNIIARTADVGTIKLDQEPIGSERFAQVLGRDDFSFAVLKVSPGSHNLTSQGCGILATAYGYGHFESYAYGGGANFTKLNANPIPEGGCLTDTIFFDAGLSPHRYSFLWDLGDGTTLSDATFMHQYDSLGTYQLSLEVHDRCLDIYDTSYQELEVTLRQEVSALPFIKICESDTLLLGATDIVGADYEWKGPGNYFSHQQFPQINGTPLEMTGQYEVTGIVSGCATHPTFVDVEVVPLPRPILGVDTIVCDLVGRIQLYPGNFAEYLWQDGRTQDRLVTDRPGTYTVHVSNESGCMATANIILTQRCPTRIYIPNAFTPNGDEINDQFEIFAEDISALTWRILDRWGNVLFESQTITESWDGTVDGKILPAGTYLYVLHYKGYNEKGGTTNGVRSGVINLLR